MSNYNLFKPALLLLVTLSVLALISTPTAQAQIACNTPVQLSSGLSEYLYDVDGSLIVWVEDDDGDGDIWMHNLDTNLTTPLTNNATHEDRFAVRNGVVVFSAYTPSGYEVFLYNAATQLTSQITSNSDEEMGLDTDGSGVVWNADDGNDNEVYHYNISTGVTTRITDNDFDDYSAMVGGNWVLWNRYDGFDMEVYRYNLLTGVTEQISNMPAGESALHDVDSINAVWSGFDGEDSEIFYHNLDTGHTVQISSNKLEDEGPVVNGRYITWEHFDGNDSEIMLYDVHTGTARQITNNQVNDWSSWVSGDTLVWEGYDGSDFEIFSEDLNDSTIIPVTAFNDWDGSPVVSNTTLIWQSGIFFDPMQGDVAELFYVTCGSVGVTPEPTGTPGSKIDLLTNAGFESKNASGSPEMTPWKTRGSYGDAIWCNKPNKLLAHTGDCAFVFKGKNQEYSKLYQDVDLSNATFSAGDNLTLSLYISATNPAADVRIKLRVIYHDGTPPSEAFNLVTQTQGYTQVANSLTLASGNIKRIRLVVLNRSKKGKVYLDDLNLLKDTSRYALLPLP
jgi:hypothetical protein